MTQAGDTICNFNSAPGKQPYELLILGSALEKDKMDIPDGRLMISVPSAVHSHKPPLTGMIKFKQEIYSTKYLMYYDKRFVHILRDHKGISSGRTEMSRNFREILTARMDKLGSRNLKVSTFIAL